MKKNKKVLLISLAAIIILLAGYIGGSYMYIGRRFPVPEAQSLEDLMKMSYFGEFGFESNKKEIYVIHTHHLNRETRMMIESLQGIVAQEKASIMIVGTDRVEDGVLYANRNEQNFLDLFEAEGAEIIERDNDNTGNYWTPWTLIKHFKSSIIDYKYVVFTYEWADFIYNGETRQRIDNPGVNMAATISGIEGWLAVPESLVGRNEFTGLGLTLGRDLTAAGGKISQDRVEMQRIIFEEYKCRLKGHILVHQNENAYRLRDFGIQNEAFIFFTREDRRERAFRETILRWANENAPVLGWTVDEVPFVAHISRFGNFVIPMDHAANSSFYIGWEFENEGMNSKYIPRLTEQQIKNPDPTKHYLAIVVSDGDNIQWVQSHMRELYHAIDVREAMRKENEDSRWNFPISWTYPPLLSEIGTVVNQQRLNDATVNDYFVAGVSGIGYMNPSRYPYQYMDGFTAKTAAGMHRSGMNIVTILDTNRMPSPLGMLRLPNRAVINKLDFYSRFDNIDGGILQIDPTMYQGNRGKVFFSNGKPFVSLKMSLWYHYDISVINRIENSAERNRAIEMRRQYIREKADETNAYLRRNNVNSINGYSIINIHPWSIPMDMVALWVSLLDENIVLVSAEELLAMVQHNIPQRTATPRRT
jgi:hypothetical protein